MELDLRIIGTALLALGVDDRVEEEDIGKQLSITCRGKITNMIIFHLFFILQT